MLASLTTQLSFTVPGAETAIFMGVTLALLILLSGAMVESMILVVSYTYNMFRAVIGANLSDNVEIAYGDMVFKVLADKSIQNIFWAMFIVAIIMLVISTIFKTITSEFNFQAGGNAKSKILISAFKALALFVVVPVVGIFGLMIANFLLGAIVTAIEGSADTRDFIAIVQDSVGIQSAGDYFSVLTNLIKIGLLWPIAKKFFGATVGVFLRLYEIVVLFLISAPMVALIPLTENPYKKWVSSFQGRVLGLFGLVISVNFCTLLIGIVDGLGLVKIVEGNAMASANAASASGMFTTNNVAMLGSGLSGIATVLVRYSVLIAGLNLIDSISKLIGDAVGGMDYLSAGTAAGTAAMGALGAGWKRFGGAAKAGIGGVKGAHAKNVAKRNANSAKQAAKDNKNNAKKDLNGAQKELANAQAELAKAKKNGTQEEINKAQEAVDTAKGKVADAQKAFNTAKSNYNDVKKRTDMSTSQKDKLAQLQDLNNKMQTSTDDEEKNRIKDDMKKITGDLKKSGLNVKSLNDAIDNGKFDQLANEMKTMRDKGAIVRKGATRKQIVELQSDVEAQIKEKTGKVEQLRKELDDARVNETNAIAAEDNAKKNFEQAKRYYKPDSEEFKKAESALSAATGVREAATGARQLAANNYNDNQTDISRMEKFQKQSIKMQAAPTMVSAVGDFVTNITPIADIANSAFGKEFSAAKKFTMETAAEVGKMFTAGSESKGTAWGFGDMESRLKQQLEEIKARTKSALEVEKIENSGEKQIAEATKNLAGQLDAMKNAVNTMAENARKATQEYEAYSNDPASDDSEKLEELRQKMHMANQAAAEATKELTRAELENARETEKMAQQIKKETEEKKKQNAKAATPEKKDDKKK